MSIHDAQKIRVTKAKADGSVRFANNARFISNEYTLMTEYVNNKEHVQIRHDECGTLFTMRPNDFQQGKSCKVCANKKRLGNLGVREKTFQEVKDAINLLGKGVYTLISKSYGGNKEKLELRHDECGSNYFTRFNDFQQGYRCPVCAKITMQSRAVTDIASFLKDAKLQFEQEVSFEECRHKRTLRFDFLVQLATGDFFLLEYHGKQHFFIHPSSPWRHNGRVCSTREETEKRDQIKRDFAAKSGADFYEIRYDQDHLLELKKILEKYNVCCQ